MWNTQTLKAQFDRFWYIHTQKQLVFQSKYRTFQHLRKFPCASYSAFLLPTPPTGKYSPHLHHYICACSKISLKRMHSYVIFVGVSAFFFFQNSIFFSLEDNYFTKIVMLFAICQHESALLYICPIPLETPFLFSHHPTPLGYHRVLALVSLHHMANSHWLSLTYGNVYVSMLFCHISTPSPSRHCVQNVCVSFAALQVESSVLSF